MYYKKQSKDDYLAQLDLQYLQRKIPLSLYAQLNNKPAQYNIEISHQALREQYKEQQKAKETQKLFQQEIEKEKEKYIRQWQAEAENKFDKEVQKKLETAINELFKGLK